MRGRWIGPGLLALMLLAGCAGLMKHEIDISRQLREAPVGSVVVLPPSFPDRMRSDNPGDFARMLPANQEQTASELIGLIQRAIGSSVTVDSAFAPSPETLSWAAEIGKSLVRERVPLSVPPIEIPAESILVTGVVSYGMKLNQYSYHLFPFLPWTKRRFVGKRSWDHVCELESLLVRPADGFILFHVRHGELANSETRDEELLEELALRVGQVLARAFRPEP